MTQKQVRVFRHVRYVQPRNGGARRYRVELVARRTSATMYLSRTCDTLRHAHELCTRYLRRNPWLMDTTRPDYPTHPNHESGQ